MFRPKRLYAVGGSLRRVATASGIPATLLKDGEIVAQGTYAKDENRRPGQAQEWHGSFTTDVEDIVLATASVDLGGEQVDGFAIDFGEGPIDIVVTSAGKRTAGVGYIVTIKGSGPDPV